MAIHAVFGDRNLSANKKMAFLVLFSLILIPIKADGRSQPFSDLDSEKVYKHLDEPATHAIQAADGDSFDCVDIYKQPAFDHPLLKDHKLQMKPSSFPEGLPEDDLQENIHVSLELENGGCPEGTVPIMRILKDDLKVKDRPFPISGSQEFTQTAAKNIRMDAVAQTYVGDYYGGAADLDAYALTNVRSDQMSMSMVWVTDFDDPSETSYNVIQAGWIVAPGIFGDAKTRLYIHWTADAYGSTGCYNVHCPGFVLTSRTSPLGIELRPLSTYGGKLYTVRVLMYKDKITGNWWLAYQSYTNIIGYWPEELFKGFDHARLVKYGGSIISPREGPKPQLGNGHFAEEPNGKACAVRNVKIVDDSITIIDIKSDDLDCYASNPTCYTVRAFGDAYLYGGTGVC